MEDSTLAFLQRLETTLLPNQSAYVDISGMSSEEEKVDVVVPVDTKKTTGKKRRADTAGNTYTTKEWTPYGTQSPASSTSLKEEVMDVVKTYSVRDLLQFRQLARIKDHQAQLVSAKATSPGYFKKLVSDCCDYNNFITPPKSFIERLMGIDVKNMEEAMPFINDFEALFKHQGLDFKNTMTAILAILTKKKQNESKINTIYMVGPPNAGKTSLMLLLSCLYERYEIGKFGPQGNASSFWLDDLYGKELYLGDEISANPVNMPALLLLLEGNVNASTEIKYGGKPSLEPKPVILACNQHVYAACPGYADAVLSRCISLPMHRECPRTMKLRPPTELYPVVLKGLIAKLAM